MEKTCSNCGLSLPADHFGKDAKLKDGLRSYCKGCDTEIHNERDNAIPSFADYWDEPIPDTLSRPMPVPSVLDERSPILPKTVLNGAPVPSLVEQVGDGLWRWKTPKGWRVLAIHYSADPNKRPGTVLGETWLAKAKQMQSDRDWLREMEMDYTISNNEPFFPNFRRHIHVKPCAFDKEKPLLRGWDFGQGHPACVWAQIGQHNQLRVLRSLLETNKKIWEFGDLVIADTNTHFPGARKIVDYGDPAGAQESDKGATTAYLLEHYGITIYHQFSYLETGLKMMDMKLRMTEYGEPGIVLDPCNLILIQGFEGGYVLDQTASGKDKEGRLKNSPKKDGWYDHIMDALRYLILNAFTFMEEERNDEEAWNKVSLWRTNAENAKRQNAHDAIEELLL